MAVSKSKGIRVEYKSLVVIWAGLLISQFVFLVLIYMMRPELFRPDNGLPVMGSQPLITLVFALAGIAFVALSFILRRQHLQRALQDQDEGCVQTALVLGCVLSEICSLLGVLLAMVFVYRYFYLWMIVGVLGLLAHFPRKRTLLEVRSPRI
jgi:hypothetical protein